MDMKVNYGGLVLEHPIMASSTGATRDWQQAVKCEKAGFSAVVLKSVQEEELMRYNPFPRFQILRNGVPGFQSTTFYSYEQAYHGGIEDYCETIRQCKAHCSIPIIASIECVTLDGWISYAVECEKAGADALEIAPSCPSGLLIRDSSHDINHISKEIAVEIKKRLHIPVVLKMTSQVASPLATALMLANETEIDGLTLNNRNTGIDIDIDTMAPILHGGFAGHGGPWGINQVMRWIIEIYPQIQKPMSGTSGVTCGKDVIKYLLSGASTVQCGAIIYMKGYDIVRPMLEEIEAYMKKHNIEHLADIIGVAAKNRKDMNEFDRVTRYYAQSDLEKCKRCRQCEPVCIYDAINYTEKGPVINKDLCDGCGLCSSICQFGAIQMHVKE